MYSEGHPIPQDISGFQFRLIGDMTVKQFSYLAVGAILAWVSFSLPIIGILKFLLAGFFALLAIAMCFLPIDGRPADTMLILFLRALVKPNQYMYKKKNATTVIQGSTEKKTTIGHDSENKQIEEAVQKQKVAITADPLAAQIAAKQLEQAQVAHEQALENKEAHAEEIPVSKKEEKQLSQEATQIIDALAAARKHEEKTTGTTADEAHQKVLELESKLQDVVSQKQSLEHRLIELEQKLARTGSNMPEPVQSSAASIPQQQQPSAQAIPQNMKTIVGAPLMPNVPNLIAGVIKDPRGNVLTNILVEVKDRDGNPVRAFKTNALGQFVSATPLANGVYTVAFEDPKKLQKFQTIEINAAGDYISPLEVISTDAREQLRKELFQ